MITSPYISYLPAILNVYRVVNIKNGETYFEVHDICAENVLKWIRSDRKDWMDFKVIRVDDL